MGLAVVGTKFCLGSKVADQCNRNCFYMGYYLFFSSTSSIQTVMECLLPKLFDALNVGERGESDRSSGFSAA